MSSPAISFFIEPDGNIQLVGSYDRFSAKDYVNAGCFFPQTSLPNMNMMTISKSIGEILYEKGLIGHITVDLVSFPDPTSPNSHPLFWAIDLNCGMTDYSSACYFFDFLMVKNIVSYSLTFQNLFLVNLNMNLNMKVMKNFSLLNIKLETHTSQ